MASLKNIKLKILSYKKTGTVTHAMEAVSAVKMRKSQERALSGRAYAAAALSVLERLAGTADLSKHPLMRDPVQGLPLDNPRGVLGQQPKACILVVTSDKGLAGSLNSAVIRRTELLMRERELDKQNVVILAIGRRGGDYFAARGYEVAEKRENMRDDISAEEMKALTDRILSLHREGSIGACFVMYQNFLSTFEQEPTVRQIIPIRRDTMRDFVRGIRPARGKYAPSSAKASEGKPPASYTIEPDPDAVLDELLPRLLNIAVFYSVLEAKASEHSARMVAMKSATDKAKEMAHDLTRTFNKVRQAAITREVSEITSGIEAMK